MATQNMRLCVPRITILAIGVSIHMTVTVRSVCLPDALSFYGSATACGFYQTDFAKVFLGGTEGCPIDCSVDYQPSNPDMNRKYELTEMTIRFDSTASSVVLKKRCTVLTFYRTNMEIKMNCKQQEWQGGQCVDDNHCANKTTNSTCNMASKQCQCRAGYLYLWETNTCAPARDLGESCINSRQCRQRVTHTTCDTDRQCKCQPGFLKHNNSCSSGRQLKDTCNNSMQCSAVTPNATCRSGVCECTEGHIDISSTCVNARGLGEQCEDYTQCKVATQHSVCNKDNECRCQQGYIEVNDSCLSVRRLKESCDVPIQCSEDTPNSTCNNTTGVCECIEGYLEISNTCIKGLILIDDIGKNKKCLFSSGDCNQMEIERVCNSTYTQSKPLGYNVFNEIGKNYNSSVVIVVGVVCFLLGAAISGLVNYIITRNRRKTKLRSGKSSDDTTEKLSVQVSQRMNSRLVYNQDTRGNEGENDVYNHLHQDTIEVNVQSDYDHAPQQMTAEDDYSHINTCNKTSVQEPDYYGELN